MGLSGTKKRTKIGHDPNNTNWTLSTSRYGHRLLRSAGWTPGTTLGAKNAAHSAHYTVGSDSHIRIAPCVEGKGLGSKNTTDDTFGLRVLSGLLGRLNGKDTTLIEEHLDLRRGEGYVEQRGWGIHFVFGGYLVGDKIEKEKQTAFVSLSGKSSKKRKHVSVKETDEAEMLVEAEDIAEMKKLKKLKKHTSGKESEPPVMSIVMLPDEGAAQVSAAKLERMAAKAQRKELRRLKKEKKLLQKPEASPRSDSSKAKETPSLHQPRTLASSVEPPSTNGIAASGSSIPLFANGRGRHAIRHKYIDQKRMACMDEKALSEIFMIKSNG